MANMALRISTRIRIEAIPVGTGPAGLGGLNADDPAYGGSQQPGTAPYAQTKYFQDSVSVPGTAGSISLANINTALTQAVADYAAASGTTIITAADLATINSWFSGNP